MVKRGSQSLGFMGSAHDTLATFTPYKSSFAGSNAFMLGVDMDSGKAFGYDPIGWMHEGRIDSKVQCNLAKKNHGKTSLMIAIMMLYALYDLGGEDARITVDDIRRNFSMGEYVKIAEKVFGSVPVKFDDPINNFDPAFGFTMSENLETAVEMLMHANNHRIPSVEEIFTLQIAVAMMFEEYAFTASPETLTRILFGIEEADIVKYMDVNLNSTILDKIKTKTLATAQSDSNEAQASVPTRELTVEEKSKLQALLNKPMNILPDEIISTGARLGMSFMRLLKGDFGNRFGGDISLAERMQQDFVLMDYSGMNNKTVALMQSLFWRIKMSAMKRMDRRYMFHLEGHDENYKFWNYLPYAEAMSEYLKQIRAYETLVIMNTHRLRDYYSVGSENSRERQLATNMFGDVGFWFIGKLNSRDAQDVKTLLNLEQNEAERFLTLTTGQWGVKLGDDPVVFVDTTAGYTELMEYLTRSNMANENLLPV